MKVYSLQLDDELALAKILEENRILRDFVRDLLSNRKFGIDWHKERKQFECQYCGYSRGSMTGGPELDHYDFCVIARLRSRLGVRVD